MASRQLARVPQKVTHRHRIGSHVFRRVSEIAFIDQHPKAILRWIDSTGVRIPIYVDLDPSKLKRINTARSVTYRYDGTTTDPSDTYFVSKAPASNS
jgi:hypothetical protein